MDVDGGKGQARLREHHRGAAAHLRSARLWCEFQTRMGA